MKLESLGVWALLAYLVALLVVAEVARRARRDNSPQDHFLAGRELGVFVLFLTLYATGYSGNSLLGYPGEAYRRGFSWVMSVGFMLGIIVCFHLVVPRLRPIALRERFVSPADWIRHRFGDERWGRALRVAVALLMAIALANFLFAQLKAMGELAEQVTGGVVPYALGVLILAAMILLYETLGGMRAVAWTDTGQGLLMLFGLTALLVWVLGASGGIAGLTAQVYELRPDAVRVPDRIENANWLSSVVLLGLGSAVYPQAIQRIFAARSARDLRGSMALMSFMPFATTAVVFLIGIAAIPRFSDLGISEADRVMPRLLSEWAETGPLAMAAALLVFVGALAAIMSTADSVLLSLSSICAKDFLSARASAAEETRLGKRIAFAIMLAMAILTQFREISLWRLIELKMELLIQCAPVFLAPLHWGGMRAGPGLSGLVVGAGITVYAFTLGETRIEGFHTGVLALAVNLAIAVGGSLLLPAPQSSSSSIPSPP